MARLPLQLLNSAKDGDIKGFDDLCCRVVAEHEFHFARVCCNSTIVITGMNYKVESVNCIERVSIRRIFTKNQSCCTTRRLKLVRRVKLDNLRMRSSHLDAHIVNSFVYECRRGAAIDDGKNEFIVFRKLKINGRVPDVRSQCLNIDIVGSYLTCRRHTAE